MACCCNKILELCKVPVCGGNAVIKLSGATAVNAGNYKLVLQYLGVDVVLNKTFAQNEELIFPASDLNEDYKYTGSLFAPDGLIQNIQIGDDVYDCVSFQTVIEYAFNEPE